VLIYDLPIVEELHPFFLHHMVIETTTNTLKRSHMLTSNNVLHRPVHLRSHAPVDTTMHKMIRADAGGTHGGSLLRIASIVKPKNNA
jgi:hypothetical protein